MIDRRARGAAARRGPTAAALLLAALCTATGEALAQGANTLARARAYYEQLAYDSAIGTARRALAAPSVSQADQVQFYELLGYASASADSAGAAVAAFRELIQLAPDREPDPQLVSPKITTLYAQALGQVLVVRRFGLDSATFVSGEGAAMVRFQLSRAAIVKTRVVGPGVDMVVDSQSLAGAATVRWNAMTAAGAPVAPGRYLVIVKAVAGREDKDYVLALRVAHAPLDTAAHVTSLAGYQEQPETEQPGRDWSPLGLAASYVGIGLAASLALRNVSLGENIPAGVTIVGSASLGLGFALSLRRPPPRPVPSGVLYNRLLRDFIARRNQDIAQSNAALRQKVQVTIVAAEP